MRAQRMGERTQREAGRYTIISDLVTCRRQDTQPYGDPECFTDQHTQSLLNSAILLTQTDSTPSYSLIHPQTPSHALSHRHTHTHTCARACAHTRTHAQSLQEHEHRKHGDPGTVITHQACGACGNSPESQLRSVAGSSTPQEPPRILETP